MDTVIIDISELETPADLHEIIKLKLDLPEYYGRNLDALHDVLTSVSSLHLILCGSGDTYNSIIVFVHPPVNRFEPPYVTTPVIGAVFCRYQDYFFPEKCPC